MILNLKLEYNPDTETVKVKSCKIEKETPEAPAPRVEESTEPQLRLDSGKYYLNSAAVELMGIAPDAKIAINYDTIGGIEYPIIGTEEAFGVGGGNKLSKNLSVIYKGAQNKRLATFGNEFMISPAKEHQGLYVLIGNAEAPEIPDEIEIIEDMTTHNDLPEGKVPEIEPAQEVPSISFGSDEVKEEEPLTFDDDFDFEVDEESEEGDTLISEDALTFE